MPDTATAGTALALPEPAALADDVARAVIDAGQLGKGEQLVVQLLAARAADRGPGDVPNLDAARALAYFYEVATWTSDPAWAVPAAIGQWVDDRDLLTADLRTLGRVARDPGAGPERNGEYAAVDAPSPLADDAPGEHARDTAPAALVERLGLPAPRDAGEGIEQAARALVAAAARRAREITAAGKARARVAHLADPFDQGAER